MIENHPTTFDPRHFRDALGHYASGITIVSGTDAAGPIGFTCQSFYSVSVEPPLISFSVMKDSTTYPRIRDAGKFAINVLANHQKDISSQFARKGTDKWANVAWQPTEAGNPVIQETLLWLDCDIWAEHDAGDHLIVIGKVNEMSPPEWHKNEPLIFFKGQYRVLAEATA